MTGNDYQRQAMRTASERCRDISNAALGLTGEAGEVADVIKKHLYQGHPLDAHAVCKELGDVMWYVALMATMIGISLDDIMQCNIDKLLVRYPDGFSAHASMARVDLEAQNEHL